MKDSPEFCSDSRRWNGKRKVPASYANNEQHKNCPSHCGTGRYHVNFMEPRVARNDNLFAVVFKLVLYAIIHSSYFH